MIKQSIYILLIACLVFACKSEAKKEAQKISIAVNQELMSSPIKEQLSTTSKEFLKDWGQFHNVATEMERYTSITKSQALENAKDLSLLIKKTSDSIKVEVLERPDIRIRLNVLYNHSLRLSDMSTISSITDEEVSHEVESMLLAYSSINEKINVIYKIVEYEKLYSDDKRKVIDSIAELESKDEVTPKKPFVPKKFIGRKTLPKNITKD